MKVLSHHSESTRCLSKADTGTRQHHARPVAPISVLHPSHTPPTSQSACILFPPPPQSVNTPACHTCRIITTHYLHIFSWRELVREHIKSLKTVSSHYSRAKSPHKKYLPPGLNKVTLYDMYRDWIKKNNNKDKEVKQWLYEWIFDHEFNIGFEPPKSDSCNVCDRVNTELEGHNKNPTQSSS